MSVRKAASELGQADLFPADAAAAKARRERRRGQGPKSFILFMVSQGGSGYIIRCHITMP